jgi:hypothetical protein
VVSAVNFDGWQLTIPTGEIAKNMPVGWEVFAGDYRFARVVLSNIAQRMRESPLLKRLKLAMIIMAVNTGPLSSHQLPSGRRLSF